MWCVGDVGDVDCLPVVCVAVCYLVMATLLLRVVLLYLLKLKELCVFRGQKRSITYSCLESMFLGFTICTFPLELFIDNTR